MLFRSQVTGKLCPAMWTHNDSELEGWHKFQKMFAPELVNDELMYYVQVGAFKSKANAEKYLENVKKDYPGAFIKVI